MPTTLLVVVIIVVLAYMIASGLGYLPGPGPATHDDQGGKMSASRRRFVTMYLILLGIAFIFMEVSLLSIDFPDTPRVPEPALIQGPAPSSESQKGEQTTPVSVANGQANGTPPPAQNSPTPVPHPVIQYVLPQSTIGNTPNMWLTVYGQNFTANSKIRLNGREAAMRTLSSNLLAAQLSPADLLNVGAITIDVVDANRASNALIVPVNKPRVPLNLLIGKPPINRELQLLLLVCFAGALGSYIHALKSATAYIGNRNMGGSWFWWYMSGPFIGMAMSLIFYSVLRGGFLAGTPADEKVVNPFGVVAVGALVGMFADKAALKLGEIFETLFKSGDPRSGKLDSPTITSLDPSKLLAGKESQTVTVKGERLGKVSMVRFNATEVKPDFVSSNEVHFTLSQKDLETPRVLNISVIDPQAGASISAKLPIVGPKIASPETLPPATANSPYQANIVAAEGAAPYQWSIEPNWLRIDANGQITGTPTTAGDVQVKVTVRDNDGASAQKTYTLTVNP